MRIEDLVRFPPPGFAVPTRFRFSPGDRWITWLASPESGTRQALFGMDAATGATQVLLDPRSAGGDETKLTLEEQLRRERLRERSVGVTAYQWAERGTRLLVPLAGALLVKDDATAPARELVPATGGPILEPRLSPDGEWVGFVRDAELYVVPAAGGEPRQTTHGARGTGRTHGLAEYIAQEEMHRHRGWWWSEDARLVAFTEVDETHIPVYRIAHQGKDDPGAHEDHRYPFAGAANAKVRLGVVSRDGGDPVWMDLGDAEYLARADWMPDGSLLVQTQDRRQQTLDLLRLDPATGRATRLLRENAATWVNLHDMLRPVPPCAAARDGGFLWASERTGFRHLQLHGRDGTLIRELTSGPWMVDAVTGLDAARGLLWFTGTKDGPTERHLYEVALGGGEPRRISRARGMHDAVLDHAKRRYVGFHSSLTTPPTVRVYDLADGSPVRPIHDARDPRIDEMKLAPPEIAAVRSRDGAQLYAAVYKPAGGGRGPFPVIVSVYGGPHVQRVQDAWDMTANMRAQYLRSLGFVVLVVDNRGSSRRGHAFEAALHRNMGDVEVRDQEDGVRWLAAQGLGDPARVGIYGWSYGGYMAAMALARAPGTFRAACAGAPVTSWDGYDSHYTERYMGLPAENAEGYRASSVMTHVPHVRGALMLVHGMLDENVHFRHTARLVNALNRARREYELLMYPDERHLPRSEADRIHMEETVRDFFVRELGAPRA